MRPIVLPFIFILFTSCNLITQSKSEPVIVIAPETKPSNFDTNDSSFLKLLLRKTKPILSVSLFDYVHRIYRSAIVEAYIRSCTSQWTENVILIPRTNTDG